MLEAAENDPTQAKLLERMQNRPSSALKKTISVPVQSNEENKLEIAEQRKFSSDKSAIAEEQSKSP